MFVERDRLVISECKSNMTSLRGQASWAKVMSLRGKQAAPFLIYLLINLLKQKVA